MDTSCRILAKASPFSVDILECHVEEGFALSEILSETGVYSVDVDGEPLSNPHIFVVGPSTRLIAIVGRPGAAAGSLAYSSIIAAIAGTGSYAAAASAIGAFLWAALPYAAALAALISVATLDIPEVAQEGPPKKLNSLTGSKNQSNPYGPVPVVYGKRRMYPAVCSTPFTELVGPDQYLNILYMVSLGKCDVSDPKIGDTALDTLNTESETNARLTAYYPNPPLFFEVQETSLGIQLDDPNMPEAGTIFTTATTDTAATDIGVDFRFPAGLRYTNSEGYHRTIHLYFGVEFREHGTSDPWVSAATTNWADTTVGGGILDTPNTGEPGNIYESNTPTLIRVGTDTGTTLTVTSVTNLGNGYTRIVHTPTHYATPLCPLAISKPGDPAGGTIFTNLPKYAAWLDDGTLPQENTTTGNARTSLIVNTASITTMGGLSAAGTFYLYFAPGSHGNCFRVSNNTRDPFQVGIKFPTPAPGQYDVRIVRYSMTQWDGTNTYNITFAESNDGTYTNSTNVEFEKYIALMEVTNLKTYTENPVFDIDSTVADATYLYLRIRANDQLNGGVDNLNIIAERRLQAWNGTSFTALDKTAHYNTILGRQVPYYSTAGDDANAKVYGRSPAWAFLDILTNRALNQKAYPLPASPSQGDIDYLKSKIDLDGLRAWDLGLITTEGFHYDEVIDYTSSAYDALKRAAGVAWAGMAQTDGKFQVLIEQAGNVRQMFTPRNSWNIQVQKTFIDPPHGIKVEFDNEERDWEQDMVVAYAGGYAETSQGTLVSGHTLAGSFAPGAAFMFSTAGTGDFAVNEIIHVGSDPTDYTVLHMDVYATSYRRIYVTPQAMMGSILGASITGTGLQGATKFENIRLPGVTSRTNARKHGHRILAMAKLRPETFSWDTGVENLLVTRGDVVSLQFDGALLGVQSARIVSITSPVANTHIVTLDEDILTVAGGGTLYALRCRLSDASPVVFEEANATPVQAYGTYATEWTITGNVAANWAPGDLVAVGVRTRVTRSLKILNIVPGDELSATITAVDENPSIYVAHEQEIPAYDPGITIPADPNGVTPTAPVLLPIVINPNQYDEATGGGRRYFVGVNYRPGSPYDLFASMSARLRYRVLMPASGTAGYVDYVPATSGPWLYMTTPQATGSFRVSVEIGVRYEFQVQLISNNNGMASLWSNAENQIVTIVSDQTLLPVGDMTVTGTYGGFYLDITVTGINSNNVDHFEVVYGTANNRASGQTYFFSVTSSMVSLNTIRIFLPETAVNTYYFWIRWVDRYSVASGWFPSNAASGIAELNLAGNEGPPGPQGDPGTQGPPGDPGPAGNLTLSAWANRRNFAGTGGNQSGYIYIHGFDTNGLPQDTAGTVIHNGDQRTINQGTLKAVADSLGDSYIAYDLNNSPFTSNGSGDGTTNYHMGLVKRFRDGAGGAVWQYDANGTWTTFSITIDTLIIGTYTKSGGAITSCTTLGNALSPYSIPVERANIVSVGDISNGAIDNVSRFASSLSPISIVSNLPTAAGYDGSLGYILFRISDRKLYRYVASPTPVWVAEINDVADVITTTHIADDQISTPKLQANSVIAAKIAANAVIAGKIAANAVTAGTIEAAAVTAREIAAGAITAGKLAVRGDGACLTINPAMDDLEAWFTSETYAANLSTNSTNYSLQTLDEANSADILGSVVLQMSQTGANAQGRLALSRSVPLDSTKKYRVRGSVRSISGTTPTAWFVMVFFNQAGTLISTAQWSNGGQSHSLYHTWGISNTVPSTSWTEYTEVIGSGMSGRDFPSAARYMAIGAIGCYGGSGNSVQQFQNLRVEEVLQGTLIEDGAITTAKIAAAAVDTSKLSVYNVGPSITPDPSLAVMGSWHSDSSQTSRLTALPAVFTQRSDSEASYIGRTALQVARTSSSTLYSVWSPRIPVDTLKVYRAQVAARRSSTSGLCYTSFCIAFYDAAGAFIANTWPISPGTNSSNYHYWGQANTALVTSSWTRFEQVFGAGVTSYNIPATARSMAIGVIAMDAANTSSAQVLLQNLRIEEAINATLIADGSITTSKITSGAIFSGQLAVAATFGSSLNADPLFLERLGSLDLAASASRGAWVRVTTGDDGTVVTVGSSGVAGANALRSTVVDSRIDNDRPIPISVTSNYRFTVWARQSAAYSNHYGFGVCIRFLTETLSTINPTGLTGWAFLDSFDAWGIRTTLTGSFQQLSFSFGPAGGGSIPSTAKYVQLILRMNDPYTGASVSNQDVQDARLVQQLTSGEITANAITADKINAGAVTADKIFAQAVTADKLESNMILTNTIVVKESNESAITGRRLILDQTTVPLWIGLGTKNRDNARLQYDSTADELLIRGQLTASTIAPLNGETLDVISSDGTFAPMRGGGVACYDGTYGLTQSYPTNPVIPGGGFVSHPSGNLQVRNPNRLVKPTHPFMFKFSGLLQNTSGSTRTVRYKFIYRYDTQGAYFDVPGSEVFLAPMPGITSRLLTRRMYLAGRANWISTLEIGITMLCVEAANVVFLSGYEFITDFDNLSDFYTGTTLP